MAIEIRETFKSYTDAHKALRFQRKQIDRVGGELTLIKGSIETVYPMGCAKRYRLVAIHRA